MFCVRVHMYDTTSSLMMIMMILCYDMKLFSREMEKKVFFVLRLIVVTLCKFLLENFSYSCDKIELSHPMRNNAMRQLAGFYGDVKFISFWGLLAMNKNLLG